MPGRLGTELGLDAPDMAPWRRRPARGIVRRADQGCQHINLAFGRRPGEAGLTASIGSRGDCSDNAMAKRFCAALECEQLSPGPTGRPPPGRAPSAPARLRGA